MAEDPPQPGKYEPKTNPGQSAVARVLLASSLIDQNEGRREQVQASNQSQESHKPMEISHRVSQFDDCQAVDSESTNGSPTMDNSSFNQNNYSPDVYITSPPSSSGLNPSDRLYNCRFCNFSTMTYTQLQLHMPKHGGLKALKCPMCDYSTNDKSNFRRHKRLHMRNNPATVLRCGKCDFSTVLPRKIREHYIQDHGEDYGPPIPQMPEAVRIQTFGDNHFNGRHMEIPHNQCAQAAIPVTGTIHTLLGAAPPSMQFGRTEPQLLANCVTQYRPYEVPAQRVPQDNHMASDYLRSIVSNIITTHHAPRVPATSTITSSSFYLPPPVESSQGLSPLTHPLSMRQQPGEETSGEEVKVKVEPVDCDGASDVSSSATPICTSGPRHMEAQTTHKLSMKVTPSNGDRNNEATPTGVRGLNGVNSSEAAGSQSGVTHTAVTRESRPFLREHRSTVDSRDHRLTVDSCDHRLMLNAREQRLIVDSCDHRSMVDSRDNRLTVDLRDLRSTVDTRILRPTLDPREVRSSLDNRDHRPILDSCDARQVIDTREIRTLIDTREHRPIIDQHEVRPTIDIQYTNVPIKTEMSNVGIQCALPVVKTETNLANDPYERRRTRTFLVERSVQCELLSSGRRISSTRVMSESGDGDQSSLRPASKCTHCGVTFEDEVLFSIHIGCHSHTDPFVCNVCGKQCYNKYGFYSHIMRGHQV